MVRRESSVSFSAFTTERNWATWFAWELHVRVRDSADEPLTGRTGSVLVSYSTSRGVHGTLPDTAVDQHSQAFPTLPDVERLALVPGEVVTFAASFEAAADSEYASSTMPVTTTITALATDLALFIHETRGVEITPSSISLTTVMAPYDEEGDPEEAPEGTWILHVRSASGIEAFTDTRPGGPTGVTLDWVVNELEPATAYVATVTYLVEPADQGRRVCAFPAVHEFSTPSKDSE